MTQKINIFLVLILGLFVSQVSIAVNAQNDFDFGKPVQEPGKQDQKLPDFDLNSQFGGFGGNNSEPRADFEASFEVFKGQGKGLLSITAKPDTFSHSHIYSQNTDLEYQTPTVFTVTESADFKLTGKFQPDTKPITVSKDVNGQTWVTEEFTTDVTWTAPIEFADGVDVEKIEIKTRVEGQVCNEGGCLPYENVVATAKFKGYLAPGPYRSTRGSNKVEWAAKASSTTVKPGDKLTVTLTARIDAGWHIYGTKLIEQETYSPTLVFFANTNGLTFDAFSPNVEAEEKRKNEERVEYHHEGEVVFSAELTVPDDAESGSVEVFGNIAYQTCDVNGSCLQPSTADFLLTVNVGAETDAQEQTLIIKKSNSKYENVLEKFKTLSAADQKEPFVLSTFLWYCGLSLLAGLILNVMPCVLPVIGLKMMSFIEQAGENRGRIFALNAAFSLGLMSVFWLLGFLVVIMDFGWGDLLNKGLTGIIIASGVVFAFGLSFMGVWEIPIPGFASSSGANKLAEKEGLGGAYLKGILTTVLATPCVGPMLIPAMTFAVTQSWFVGFAIFTMLGLGMAFPFLLVAVFPGAIKILPKPGAWMETFKQVMGFVLIGTVLFLLSTFAKPSEDTTPYVLPVMAMLLAIGVGCWWIGRTSIAAEFKEKVTAYVLGIAIIAGGTWAGFYVLGPPQYELEWEPYSNSLLADLREEGKPILIDFTGPG